MALWQKNGLTLIPLTTDAKPIHFTITQEDSQWKVKTFVDSEEVQSKNVASEAAGGTWVGDWVSRANSGGVTIIIDTDDF